MEIVQVICFETNQYQQIEIYDKIHSNFIA